MLKKNLQKVLKNEIGEKILYFCRVVKQFYI